VAFIAIRFSIEFAFSTNARKKKIKAAYGFSVAVIVFKKLLTGIDTTRDSQETGPPGLYKICLSIVNYNISLIYT
jgi:hypothetical protein